MSSQNETTNIDDLPTVGGSTNSPVQNVFNENNTENIKIPNYGEQLNSEKEVAPAIQNIDYTSKLSSTLKEVSSINGGAIPLPSRDIPQNALQVHNDVKSKVNIKTIVNLMLILNVLGSYINNSYFVLPDQKHL